MPKTDKLKKGSQRSSHRGCFKTACGSAAHIGWDKLNSLHSGCKIGKEKLKKLYDLGVISKKTKYICNGCLELSLVASDIASTSHSSTEVVDLAVVGPSSETVVECANDIDESLESINDKLLVQYNNSVSPGESYSFLRKWILSEASEPTPVPKWLLKCIFDNEQLIGKTRLFQAEKRVGVRRGCFLTMNAGKDKLIKLFYAGNHPKYQRIMAVDKLFQQSMLEKVKDIIRYPFSTSRVGHEGCYQGGDACPEEINKNAKSWVSRGVPSNDKWLKIF
eukprot:gene9659-17421_t